MKIAMMDYHPKYNPQDIVDPTKLGDKPLYNPGKPFSFFNI